MQSNHTFIRAKRRSKNFAHSAAFLLSSSVLVSLVLLPLAPVFAADSDIQANTPTQTSTSTETSSAGTDTGVTTSGTADVAPTAEAQVIENTSVETNVDSLGANTVSEAISTTTKNGAEKIITTSETPTTTSTNIILSATNNIQIQETPIQIEITPTTTSSSSASTTVQGLPIENPTSTNQVSDATSTNDNSTTTITDTIDTITDPIQQISIEQIAETPIPSDTTPTDNTLTTENATTTADVVLGPEQTVATSSTHTDDNHVVFSKDKCVSVGDGSFYCNSDVEPVIANGINRVFSAPDSTGDREIYIEKNEVMTQITDNTVDDDAPYFDEVSNTVVWHRLVNERYQIMEYSFDTQKEMQLTNDRYNNMEPMRYGALTVWQGWIGNDWEIMLDDNGELTMLTDNTTNDIAPNINGEYIIWQSFESDVWKVKVYDRTTKKTETIGDADGSSVENPRFVLVYDTKSNNGDVETKGFDLMSKKTVPLSSRSAPMPKDLPQPDQTGENRALVQPPIQVKTKSTADTEPNFNSDPEPDLSATSTATSTGDIVIEAYIPISETNATGTQQTTGQTNQQLPDDLIIPSVDSVATSTTIIPENIEELNLIISPFVESIEIQLDSQDEVASST